MGMNRAMNRVIHWLEFEPTKGEKKTELDQAIETK